MDKHALAVNLDARRGGAWAVEDRASTGINKIMPTTFFHHWLSHREQHGPEVPEATKLMQLIAQAGPAGISRHVLGRAIELQPDTIDGLLAAMVGAGRVTVSDEDGERVYRVVA